MRQHALSFTLGLTALFMLSGCGQSEPEAPKAVRSLPVMKIDDFSAIKGRTFPGRAKSADEVDLSFRVNGPLITFPAQVGDKVTQGDVLARIDPRDFEVEQRTVSGQLQKAKATHVRAEKDYRRIVAIRKKDPGLASEAQLDRTKASYDLAKAEIISLEAALDSAEDQIKYTQLLAPYDGTVVSTYVNNFEYVNAQQPILRLLDNQRLEFVFNVPETLISLVPLVWDIKVKFDAFPNIEIPATISEVGAEASSKTNTYPVTLIMEPVEGVEILPGMTGQVFGARADLSEQQQSILVPVEAIFSEGAEEASFVWVVDESSGSVSKKPVELGMLTATGVEISEGLKIGDVIAIAGVHYLQEGQVVKPRF